MTKLSFVGHGKRATDLLALVHTDVCGPFDVPTRDNPNDRYLWHLRLGYIAEDKINKLEKNGLLSPLTFESYPTCESCLQGKMTKLPFVGHRERATDLLALVHIDVCSPFDVPTKGNFVYFIIFIDDLFWYGYIYLM